MSFHIPLSGVKNEKKQWHKGTNSLRKPLDLSLVSHGESSHWVTHPSVWLSIGQKRHKMVLTKRRGDFIYGDVGGGAH
jgi:hypothetical protein